MDVELKLPACERCRLRKVKCDGKSPKCTACEKSQSACIFIDAVTQERYTREAVFELEENLKRLEARRRDVAELAAKATGGDRTVVNGNGLCFLKHLFSTANWVSTQSDLMQHIRIQLPVPQTSMAPHPLPSFEYSKTMMDLYFSNSHVVHPFLARHIMTESLQRVYHEHGKRASAQDFYRLFMILAVSSITKYRCKEIQEHPYGFFMAAQQYVQQVPMVGSIDAIQNLLLVSRFATYYYIRCSIWDMSQLCMRQCVELGLHRASSRPLDPLTEQMQRRLFWDCYIHDRYSATILGRPYAIAEHEIDQPLPLETDDAIIATSDARTLDEIPPMYMSSTSEMSSFLFVLGLRRLITRVQKAFYSQQKRISRKHVHQISAIGHAYMEAQRLLAEFDEWRAHAPVFTSPRCLYQRSEWFDFLVEKDKMYLIRGAMAKMSSGGSQPPRDLLQACIRCAARIIDLYAAMFKLQYMTWTRSYFQILFTSGLSTMYSLITLRQNVGKQYIAEVSIGLKALLNCGRVLKTFVEEMPDARRFAMVFDALNERCLAHPDLVAISSHLAEQDMREFQQQTVPGTQQDIRSESMQPSVVTLPFKISDTPPDPTERMMDDSGPQSGVNNFSSSVFSESHVPVGGVEPQTWQTPGQTQTMPLVSAPDIGDEEQFNWSLFDEELLGQMEARIGEYAWGDPEVDINMWNDFTGGIT